MARSAKGILFIVCYGISFALMLVVIGFLTTPLLWIWGMIDRQSCALLHGTGARSDQGAHEELAGGVRRVLSRFSENVTRRVVHCWSPATAAGRPVECPCQHARARAASSF